MDASKVLKHLDVFWVIQNALLTISIWTHRSNAFLMFLLSTPNTLTTFLLLPINEPEASIHIMFLATTSWVFFGPTKWFVIPNFMLFKISWFCIIDCTLVRYLETTFCKIEWLRNFSRIKCWMEGSKSLVRFQAIVVSFLAISSITFYGFHHNFQEF